MTNGVFTGQMRLRSEVSDHKKTTVSRNLKALTRSENYVGSWAGCDLQKLKGI